MSEDKIEKHYSLVDNIRAKQKRNYEFYYDLLEKNNFNFENKNEEEVFKEGRALEMILKLKDIIDLKEEKIFLLMNNLFPKFEQKN